MARGRGHRHHHRRRGPRTKVDAPNVIDTDHDNLHPEAYAPPSYLPRSFFVYGANAGRRAGWHDDGNNNKCQHNDNVGQPRQPKKDFQTPLTMTFLQIQGHVRHLPDQAFRRRPFLAHVELLCPSEEEQEQCSEAAAEAQARKDTESSSAGLLESIGSDCFAGCRSLRSISVKERTAGTTAETHHHATNGTSTTKPVFTAGPCRKKPKRRQTGLRLPRLAHIGPGAFFGCCQLRELDLQHSQVAHLSPRTVAHCTRLQVVRLPPTLHTIGAQCFEACQSLRWIHIPAGCHDIGDGAFSGCTLLEFVQLPHGRAPGLTLGHKAFWNCASLRTIVMPQSIVRMGASTFACCPSICSIAIEASPRLSRADCEMKDDDDDDQPDTASSVVAVELKLLELLSAPKPTLAGQDEKDNSNRNDTWFSASSPLYRMGLRSKTELGSQPETTTIRSTCVFSFFQQNAARFHAPMPTE